MWKRISAALCDFIALTIVAVGVAFVLSLILGFDAKIDHLEEISEGYETRFGVDFQIPNEDYQKLSDEEKDLYEQAMDAFSADIEANNVFSLIINHILIMTTIGTLTAFFLLEFIVPLLKNYTFLNTGLSIFFNGKRFYSKNGLLDLLKENLTTDP